MHPPSYHNLNAYSTHWTWMLQEHVPNGKKNPKKTTLPAPQVDMAQAPAGSGQALQFFGQGPLWAGPVLRVYTTSLQSWTACMSSHMVGSSLLGSSLQGAWIWPLKCGVWVLEFSWPQCLGLHVGHGVLYDRVLEVWGHSLRSPEPRGLRCMQGT